MKKRYERITVNTSKNLFERANELPPDVCAPSALAQLRLALATVERARRRWKSVNAGGTALCDTVPVPTFEKGNDVLFDFMEQPLARLMGGPCGVRGDDQIV